MTEQSRKVFALPGEAFDSARQALMEEQQEMQDEVRRLRANVITINELMCEHLKRVSEDSEAEPESEYLQGAYESLCYLLDVMKDALQWDKPETAEATIIRLEMEVMRLTEEIANADR